MTSNKERNINTVTNVVAEQINSATRLLTAIDDITEYQFNQSSAVQMVDSCAQLVAITNTLLLDEFSVLLNRQIFTTPTADGFVTHTLSYQELEDVYNADTEEKTDDSSDNPPVS